MQPRNGQHVEKRGNYCRDTSKNGIRTALKSDIYFPFVTDKQ